MTTAHATENIMADGMIPPSKYSHIDAKSTRDVKIGKKSCLPIISAIFFNKFFIKLNVCLYLNITKYNYLYNYAKDNPYAQKEIVYKKFPFALLKTIPAEIKCNVAANDTERKRYEN